MLLLMGNETATGRRRSQPEVYSRSHPAVASSFKGTHIVIKAPLASNMVDVNSRDQAGRTSLCWAAANGHGEVVQLLLSKGANLDYDDGDGRIPLLAAKEHRRNTAVEILIDQSISKALESILALVSQHRSHRIYIILVSPFFHSKTSQR